MNRNAFTLQKVPPVFYFTAVIIYLEIILKIFTCKTFFNVGLVFMPIFSLIAGGVIQLLCSLFDEKKQMLAASVSILLLTALYMLQCCYHWFFNKYLIIYSLVSGGIGQVLEGEMSSNVIDAVLNSMVIVVLLALPFFVHLFLFKRIVNTEWKAPKKHVQLIVLTSLHLVVTLVISLIPSVGRVQSGLFDPNLAMTNFGLLRTEALDIKYNLLGIGQDFELEDVGATVSPGGDDESDAESEAEGGAGTEAEGTDDETGESGIGKDEIGEDSTGEDEVGEEDEGKAEAETDESECGETGSSEGVEQWDPSEYHVSDVDFDALYEAEEDEILKKMNGYFAERIPTKKNEYTGMYEGYNLITVVAEGFSPYAIDEELTPTLYMLSQKGFRFTDFYTPIWGVSTTDGEYTVCTGLVPKAGVWSMYESSDNYMPYCLGNRFRAAGVKNVFAYHNNSYTYYHRDQSHPNMGYTFTGIGNGMEDYVENVWPQSDLEMVEGSISDYLSADEPFHAYYMTVSGHLDYSYEKNAMVRKNWDLVKDLDCSDLLKGYYACNIELDRAIERLLEELEVVGIADKTVIAITPDHYPYGLEQEGEETYAAWTELLGHEVETEFELYKSCFLLYCAGTENAPTVDKPCYAADVLPTLLNLFGFEYDSRLLIGSDILSDSEGLVILSNGSYINEYGCYNATLGEFAEYDEVLFEDEEQEENYVGKMNDLINNLFMISVKILEMDYYRYLFE